MNQALPFPKIKLCMSAVSLNLNFFFQGGEEYGSEGEEASQLEDDDTTLDDIKVKNKI